MVCPLKNKIIISGDFVPDEKLFGDKDFLKDFNEIVDEETIHITNLECPLSSSKEKILKTGPHLRANTELVKCLKDANVSVACLANNHIKDYGSIGIKETEIACNNVSIETIGASNSECKATKPLILLLNSYKIGVLNYCEEEYNGMTYNSYGANIINEINIYNDINSLKGKVDKIIVIIHWGKELYRYPTPGQQKLARFIIDIGANAIIGHHSHVRGCYEIYKDKTIIYSLGNFYFNFAGKSKEWYEGLIVQLELDKQNFIVSVYPMSNRAHKITIGKKCDINEEIDEKVLIKVDEHTVKSKWNNLIKNSNCREIENILNYGKLKKGISRYITKRVSRKNFKFLLVLRNKYRCRTHFEYLKSIIEEYFNQKKKK